MAGTLNYNQSGTNYGNIVYDPTQALHDWLAVDSPTGYMSYTYQVSPVNFAAATVLASIQISSGDRLISAVSSTTAAFNTYGNLFAGLAFYTAAAPTVAIPLTVPVSIEGAGGNVNGGVVIANAEVALTTAAVPFTFKVNGILSLFINDDGTPTGVATNNTTPLTATGSALITITVQRAQSVVGL